jgi:Helix-turn-helix domain
MGHIANFEPMAMLLAHRTGRCSRRKGWQKRDGSDGVGHSVAGEGATTMPRKPPDPQRVSLVAAAAALGETPSALRWHLTQAKIPPVVNPEDGRAYLPVTLDKARELIYYRRLATESLRKSLPGWGTAKVARVLGIKPKTVYTLRQLGRLPAMERKGVGLAKWRWAPAVVKAYAERVGRQLAEDTAPGID